MNKTGDNEYTARLLQRWLNKNRQAGLVENGWAGENTRRATARVLAGFLPDSAPREATTPITPADPAKCVSGYFPVDTDAALNAFYGSIDSVQTVPFNFAYTVYLFGDQAKPMTSHRCHPKIKDALEAVFRDIRAEYSDAEIAFLGLDRYYGCLNKRRRTGGGRWSIHAWAAAIDLDASRNGFGLRWSPEHAARPGKAATPGWAWMPERVVQMFECRGFSSGARWRTADAMHFEGVTR